MFSLPRFTILTENVAEDLVDRLNSEATFGLLLFLAAVTGSKQNFGSPLQCMIPAESVGSWVKYYHDYCYIQNDLKMDPYGNYTRDNGMKIGGDRLQAKPVYYQWVPYVLLLQAVFFLLPRRLWRYSHRKCFHRVDVGMIKEAAFLHKSKGNEREKNTKALAEFIYRSVDVKGRKRLGGYMFTLFYVIRKWLAFINVIFQFILLAHLISANEEAVDFSWGWKILCDSLSPPVNAIRTGFFPTVIRCDVVRLESGFNENWTSIHCVLMMNFINEKIFLFIYFWLIALAFINFLAAIRSSVFFTVASYRHETAKKLIPSLEVLIESTPESNRIIHGERLLDYFIRILRPDGLLTLMFIYDHAGGFVTFEVAKDLWNLFIDSWIKRNPLDAAARRNPHLLSSVDQEDSFDDLL